MAVASDSEAYVEFRDFIQLANDASRKALEDIRFAEPRRANPNTALSQSYGMPFPSDCATNVHSRAFHSTNLVIPVDPTQLTPSERAPPTHSSKCIANGDGRHDPEDRFGSTAGCAVSHVRNARNITYVEFTNVESDGFERFMEFWLRARRRRAARSPAEITVTRRGFKLYKELVDGARR
jgi:hypothetical protein